MLPCLRSKIASSKLLVNTSIKRTSRAIRLVSTGPCRAQLQRFHRSKRRCRICPASTTSTFASCPRLQNRGKDDDKFFPVKAFYKQNSPRQQLASFELKLPFRARLGMIPPVQR